MNLDSIDRRILQALQKNGKLHNFELADRIGLSPSPCLRRVRLLEESGIIRRYVALLDPQKLNIGLTVYARIWLDKQDGKSIAQFIQIIQDIPEIVECQLMAGDYAFLLKVMVSDLNSYREFQFQKLNKISGIVNIITEIPLETVKFTTEYPI